MQTTNTSIAEAHGSVGVRLPRLLSRTQLHELIGRGMKLASFTNWLYRMTRDRGFPRPIIMADRAVAWREDLVLRWIESRPQGGQRNAVRRKAA